MIATPLCRRCIHLHADSLTAGAATCDAFPEGDGILPAIILGRVSHRDPVDGDHGIQFEAESGGEDAYYLGRLEDAFKEGEHPRGNPENKGQFKAKGGSKGQGGGKPESVAPGAGKSHVLGLTPGQLSEKALLAKKFANPAGKAHQIAADEQEAILSRALGLPRTPNNSPFDLQPPMRGGKTPVAIECKTVLYSKNGKITMQKPALEKKFAEIKRSRIKKFFTVVIDKRGSRPAYYFAAKLGSLRIPGHNDRQGRKPNLHPVTVSTLREIVRRFL